MDLPPDRIASPAIVSLCEELQALANTLGPILARMHHYKASRTSAPDAPPIREVLDMLLSETLAPMSRRHADDEIARAAALLAEARQAIAEEIIIVPLPGTTSKARRRGRGHRSRLQR
jgi:hypothetical protein